MVKKAIHHFNRGIVIGLEIVGLVAVMGFFAWVALIWRLSQGPLNVDFLTARLEKSLNEQETGFVFDVGTTQMLWGERFEPFRLELQHVQISRSDSTPVLAVEKVGVLLSKRNLAFGRIVPKEIRISGPALRVVRHEDGHFSLNLSGEREAASPQEGAPDDDGSHIRLIRGLLYRLREGEGLGILGGLQEIRVEDAAVFYEDKILGGSWRAKKSGIVFKRSKGGLLSNTVLDLVPGTEGGDMPEIGGSTLIRASVFHGWQSGTTNAVLYFSNLNPAQMATGSPVFRHASGVDMNFKGSISVDLDRNFRPGLVRVILGADPGRFNVMDLYPQPIDVKYLYLTGRYDMAAGAGEIESLKVDIGQAKAEATLQLSAEGDVHVAAVKGTLSGMAVDDLGIFWPGKLAPDAQKWVTGHLSKGTADRATIDAVFSYAPAAEKKIGVRRLGGQIDFHGIDVDYLPPLKRVSGVRGKAVYDAASFNLDIASGKLGDMDVTKSVIKIGDLDKVTAETHAAIDIAVSLKGPLKTAMDVLDSKPLEYPKMLGLDTSGIDGAATVDVGFRFPLYKGLTMAEVEVRADAKITGGRLLNVVKDYALTEGEADLSVSNDALSIKGGGRLGGMPVTYDWARYFKGKEGVSSRVAAQLELDSAALVKLGVPADFAPKGTLGADIVHTAMQDGTENLLLKGDATSLAFRLPVVGFEKREGIKGALDMLLHFRGGAPYRLSGLSLQTEGIVLQGDLEFGPDAGGGYRMTKALFDRVLFGGSDIRLEAERNAADGYVLRATGGQLDLSKMLEENDLPGDNAKARAVATPVTLTLDVKRLLTGEDKALNDVKMFLVRNQWQRLEQLEMDAEAGGKAVYLRYMPATGGHSLRFEADNAGAALRALGITNAIRGGRLVVDGQPAPGGTRDLKGSAMLTDFALKDTPVLARLLNAMSLTGILQLLNGEGISFKKARADFIWTDRGPPADGKILRHIRIGDGQTSGASLGLTFEGNIDNWGKEYDLNGTIIPVSDLNKLLSIIPLVGDVLTAGGEGVIAATYTIRGPMDQPTVTVNPLAALAPGILRKLFFEN